MYRVLVMLPQSVDPAESDSVMGSISSAFAASAGCQTVSRSIGPLMGPAAQTGEIGAILEADFVTLEDVMVALHAEDFQVTKTRTEALGTTLFLFEVQVV